MNGGWVVVAGLLGIFFGFRWGVLYTRKTMKAKVNDAITLGLAHAIAKRHLPMAVDHEEVKPSSARKH